MKASSAHWKNAHITLDLRTHLSIGSHEYTLHWVASVENSIRRVQPSTALLSGIHLRACVEEKARVFKLGTPKCILHIEPFVKIPK